jgi:hypothetical protein
VAEDRPRAPVQEHAGHTVEFTGEMTGDTITVSKIAMPAKSSVTCRGPASCCFWGQLLVGPGGIGENRRGTCTIPQPIRAVCAWPDLPPNLSAKHTKSHPGSLSAERHGLSALGFCDK